MDDLRQFAADCGRVNARMKTGIDRVMKRAAVNIKNTMRDDFSRSKHFHQIGKTINFDIESDDSSVEVEIGPDKRYRSGRLANIAYFGSSRGGGGTVDVENGLRKEAPVLSEYLRRVMGDVL